jgi:hypothetical protein
MSVFRGPFSRQKRKKGKEKKGGREEEEGEERGEEERGRRSFAARPGGGITNTQHKSWIALGCYALTEQQQ